jgi:hypothetical protein
MFCESGLFVARRLKGPVFLYQLQIPGGSVSRCGPAPCHGAQFSTLDLYLGTFAVYAPVLVLHCAGGDAISTFGL